MHLTVQGKQMDVGDALRTHVQDKLEDINRKFFNHATDATVTFSREGHGRGLFNSHVHIRIGKNIVVMADSQAGDAYGAFEKTAEKVTTQLRRYKNRLRSHHEKMQAAQADILPALSYVLANEDTEEDQDDGQQDAPIIIAEMATAIQTLSVSDAVMRMDLENQAALLFRNAKHGELNMVYRRADGNIGWIDPAQALGGQKSAQKTVKKKAAKKPAAKKTAAKKAPAKKAPAKKTAAKKAAAKKSPVKKAVAKKSPVKKTAAKKAPAKKTARRG